MKTQDMSALRLSSTQQRSCVGTGISSWRCYDSILELCREQCPNFGPLKCRSKFDVRSLILFFLKSVFQQSMNYCWKGNEWTPWWESHCAKREWKTICHGALARQCHWNHWSYWSLAANHYLLGWGTAEWSWFSPGCDSQQPLGTCFGTSWDATR